MNGSHIGRISLRGLGWCLAAGLLLGLHAEGRSAERGEPMAISGITKPVADAELSAPVSGNIGEVFFNEGDYVEKGEVILELDRRLEELELERRQIVVDRAKTELDRLEHLYENSDASNISASQVEQQRSDYQVARAEYEIAEENLNRRQITAPFSGWIADFYGYEEGEGIQAQAPVVRLVDIRKCLLVCTTEPRLGYQFEAGDQVPLEVQAGESPTRTEGTVRFVSPIVDAASGLMELKVVFENPEGAIRPGEEAKILLQ